MQLPHFQIVRNTPDNGPLVIRDMNSGQAPSVTNGAEEVVANLVDRNLLPPGRRLLYYDSEGQLDEIVVNNGRFAGFKPGPGPMETVRLGMQEF